MDPDITWATGKTRKGTGMANISMMMAICMPVFGKTINRAEKVQSSTLRGTRISATGKMATSMAKEDISKRTVRGLTVFGTRATSSNPANGHGTLISSSQ